jgi:hypothetical protein
MWDIVVLRKVSNFSTVSWWEQVTFQWDEDDVCLVLDQQVQLDFHSASWLKKFFGRCYKIAICCFYAKHAALMRMSNDRFEQPSGQTEDYKIAICCLYARHAALRSKSNDWFAQKQNNVLSDTSTKELFKSTGTMKIQLDLLV